MATAVFFHGLGAIDFQDLRLNSIRIPEVISRIKQAQRAIDRSQSKEFDLLNFLASDDAVFLANIRLKGLAAAVVQVGLFDRYLKRNGYPDLLVGDIKGDSALLAATGQLPFDDMVATSQAFREIPLEPIESRGEPLLTGISLSELAVYGRNNETGGPLRLPIESTNFHEIIRHLVDDYDVKRFVNVGPGSAFEQIRRDFALEDLQFVESIDLDPMLNWFWTDIPQNAAAFPL